MRTPNLFEWSMSTRTWSQAEQPGLMSDELLGEWFDLMNDSRLPDHAMEAKYADGHLTASYLSPDSPPDEVSKLFTPPPPGAVAKNTKNAAGYKPQYNHPP